MKRKSAIVMLILFLFSLLLLPILLGQFQPTMVQAQEPNEEPPSSFPENNDIENQEATQAPDVQGTPLLTSTEKPSKNLSLSSGERQTLKPVPAEESTLSAQACGQFIQNGGFETNTAWFGGPASNVFYSTIYPFTGNRSVSVSTINFQNVIFFQPVFIPSSADDAALINFFSFARFGDPGEAVILRIYNADFTQLLYEASLIYPSTGLWYYFEAPLPASLLAGRTVNVAFESYHDGDNFYSQIYFDDANLYACQGPPPTPAPTPTPVPALDFEVEDIEVVQTHIRDVDPVTGAPMPLIAQKKSLVRVQVDLDGPFNSIGGVDADLFVTDALGTVYRYNSINGPIIVSKNPDLNNLNSTLNFIPPNIGILSGPILFQAVVDPNNVYFESNEGNNVGGATKTFFDGAENEIAWFRFNYPLADLPDFVTALRGDSKFNEIFPVALNDTNYRPLGNNKRFFSRRFTVQNADRYIQRLELIWLRLTIFNRWQDGVPGILYGWVSDDNADGLCGVASLRRPVAVGVDGSAGGCSEPEDVFAHEIGHVVGLPHTPNLPFPQDLNCGSIPPGFNPNYPLYPGLPLGSIGLNGLDLKNRLVLPANGTYDFMSYCNPTWISPYNYTALSTGVFPIQNDLTGSQIEQRLVIVAGTVISPSMAVEWEPFTVFTSTLEPDPDDPDGEYCVEMRDTAANVLDQRCFDLEFVHLETGEPLTEKTFTLLMPYPDGTVEIVLTKRDVSDPIGDVPVSTNAPTITLDSPNGGENFGATETISVTWTANDADGDPLHYDLDYSEDGGNSWIPLTIAITQTTESVDLSNLPGSDNVIFRVWATDGVNTASDESDAPLSVGKKSPTTVIVNDDTTLTIGETLILEGSAQDAEDGTLGEEALSWQASFNNDLGTGSVVITNTFPVGTNVITLTATDSDGNTGEDTVTVTVLKGSSIYLPMILKPGEGSNTN